LLDLINLIVTFKTHVKYFTFCIYTRAVERKLRGSRGESVCKI
jgi:hypothetical protein